MRNISRFNEIYEAVMRGARQRVEITVDTVAGSEIDTITEENIVAGTFSIDRYVTSGDSIELGSAIAAELKMTLDNSEHNFDQVMFEGAALDVTIKFEMKDGSWVPMKFGKFTVDEQPRTLSTIEITALDDMVRFDKSFNLAGLEPRTMKDLLLEVCHEAGITNHDNLGSLFDGNHVYANLDYIPESYPSDTNLTCRQVLSWICQIIGKCAYMDYEGNLELGWYEDILIPDSKEKFTINLGHRYSSDGSDSSLQIEEIAIYYGDNACEHVLLDNENNDKNEGKLIAINIDGNLLIDNPATIGAGLKSVIEPLTYSPFSASCISLPFILPLDKIKFESPAGKVIHDTVVTHHTFRLNGVSDIKGKGVTTTKDGYAKANPLTQKEASIINEAKAAFREEINSRYEEILRLNEYANHSFGLFSSVAVDESGATIYYYHDEKELSQSHTVYKMCAEGNFWTKNYKGDETYWDNIITADGSILSSYISTKGIQAERLEISTASTDKDVDNATILLEKGEIDFIVSGNNAAVFNKNRVTSPEVRAKNTMLIGDFIIEKSTERQAITMTWNGEINTDTITEEGDI